jgi:hypothetical protein
MVFVLRLIGGVDEYIVKVTLGEVANIRPQKIDNVGLKRRWCICQPKGNNSVFELTIAGSEGSLELVPFFDSDEVVGILEFQFSEDPGLAHSIE